MFLETDYISSLKLCLTCDKIQQSGRFIKCLERKVELLICLFDISFSLLLRFTDDTFDPELAATIGKPMFKNLIEMPNTFLPSGCFI